MSAPAGERLGSGAMFDAIAARYDVVNRVLSVGLDQGWRRRAARALALGPGATVLDLATGTGDLAIVLAKEHGARVIGVDPSRGMLDVARRKVQADGVAERVSLREGDAQRLDLDDRSVDAVTMAFGIRNVPDRAAALREMARVTRPGGRIAILELCEPEGGVMGRLAKLHIHALVPRLGGVLSGAREYRYLQDSIAKFPPPAAFAALLRGAGLAVVEVEPLTFGVVCLFVAKVPEA